MNLINTYTGVQLNAPTGGGLKALNFTNFTNLMNPRFHEGRLYKLPEGGFKKWI
ncbi:MAG: hypothetical protein L0Y77_07465 [Chlorobi bacterium]|nr:hypothetical protein [Chlorobiota bacterium]